MTSVLIHATGVGVPQGRRNWARTIERDVDLRSGDVASALRGDEAARFAEVHPSGRAPVWGTHRYYTKIAAQLEPDDVVIFTGNSRVLAIGRIGVLTDNADLADALWPRHATHGSYRHVYTLEPLSFVGIPYPEFRRRGGFGIADDFRGLRLLTGERADGLLAEFEAEIPASRHRAPGARVDLSRREHGVDLETAPSTTGDGHAGDESRASDLTDAEDSLLARLEAMGGTDAAGAVRMVRREQSMLRERLGLGPAVGHALVQCGICHRPLPRRLLVAAHVKPRSECSENERLDIPHVAMAACLLGCDALYEAGYLTVDETGRILTARTTTSAPHLQSLLRSLQRQKAPAWTPEREPYFAWHRENRFMQPTQAVLP